MEGTFNWRLGPCWVWRPRGGRCALKEADHPLLTEGHSIQAALQDRMPTPLGDPVPDPCLACEGAWWAVGMSEQPELWEAKISIVNYESWPDSSEPLYL